MRAACRLKDWTDVSLPSPDSLLLGAAAGASFLTGLAGSGHCAVMCGPLACVGLDRNPRTRWRAALAWQLGRVGAYTSIGAFLGAVGHGGLAVARTPLARALPWVMVAGLVLSAAEVGRRLPALPGLSRVARRLTTLGSRLSPAARAALRGAVTPLLPCGLLYGAFVVAIGTGAALSGAAIMLAFALGPLPALVLVQGGTPRLAARPLVRRAVPLLAAALVAWRATGAAPHCH